MINKLLKISDCKNLKLIKKLMNMNSFVNMRKIRIIDGRGYYTLTKVVNKMLKEGIFIKKVIGVKTGNYGGIRKIVHYRININNKLIKKLTENGR